MNLLKFRIHRFRNRIFKRLKWLQAFVVDSHSCNCHTIDSKWRSATPIVTKKLPYTASSTIRCICEFVVFCPLFTDWWLRVTRGVFSSVLSGNDVTGNAESAGGGGSRGNGTQASFYGIGEVPRRHQPFGSLQWRNQVSSGSLLFLKDPGDGSSLFIKSASTIVPIISLDSGFIIFLFQFPADAFFLFYFLLLKCPNIPPILGRYQTTCWEPNPWWPNVTRTAPDFPKEAWREPCRVSALTVCLTNAHCVRWIGAEV